MQLEVHRLRQESHAGPERQEHTLVAQTASSTKIPLREYAGRTSDGQRRAGRDEPAVTDVPAEHQPVETALRALVRRFISNS